LRVTACGNAERKVFLFACDNTCKMHRYQTPQLISFLLTLLEAQLTWVNITADVLADQVVERGDGPPPYLTKHSSVTLYTFLPRRETIVIFGGLNGDVPCDSCLFLLTYNSSNSSFSWTRVSRPPVRFGHTAVAANYWRTMLVFGGAYDAAHTLTNSLDEFSVDNQTWRTIEASNPPEGLSSILT
jgi:hypothetical protein